MTRDTQIGLLLAAGFLALVGGVLYYRIEHPDELEKFWNNAELAQATKPEEQTPPNPNEGATNIAYDTGLPKTNAPSLDVPNPAPANGVLQTGANPATSLPAAPTASGTGAPSLDVPNAGAPTALGNAAANPPTVALDQNRKEPAPPPISLDLNNGANAAKSAETGKPPAAPTTSFTFDVNDKSDKEKSAPSTNSTPKPEMALPTPPAGGAPSLNFPGNTTSTPPPLEKKPEEKPLTDNTQKKPNESLPVPSSSPPSIALDIPRQDKSQGISTGAGASAVQPNINLDPPKSSAQPLWDVAPGKTNDAPPVKSEPLPKDPEIKPPVQNQPLFDNRPTQPPVNSPSLEIKPAPGPESNVQPTNPANDPGGYREYAAPRAGLGRPVPESVLAMNERRWSDSAGAPPPIIPSGAENTSSSGNSAWTTPLPERRVTSDIKVKSIRATKGETFSSLSQREYGSEIYAEALAAYNREAGIVEEDQPAGNQTVLIPTRLDLETRFGTLLRRAPGTNRPALTTGTASSTAATPTRRDARPAEPIAGPSYRVKKGEQLFDVAKVALGDGYRWSEIYSLNKDLLRDSTELRADMVLRLPTNAKVDGPKQR